MKKLFPETKMIRAAKESALRRFWLVELALFFAVFGICMFLQSAIQTPFQIVSCLRRLEPILLSGDLAADISAIFSMVMAVVTDLPVALVWLSLFTTFINSVVCIFYCKKIERRSLRSMGFTGTNPVGEYLVGFAIGTVMLVLSWAICYASGLVLDFRFSPTFALGWFLLFLTAFLIQGLGEEVMCRGYLMVSLSRRYAPWVCILLNSVVFMALHLMNPNLSLIGLLNLLLFGIFASVYMWKRGSIFGVAAIHSAWNFVQGNVLGIEVSGMQMGPSLFSTVFSENGAWLHGGTFGLEGGLSVTIVTAVAIGIAVCMPVKRSALLDD